MIVNKPDQQTYRTQIVAARIHEQNADENLILEGLRGVLNQKDLITSLASDPKLFAPDPKHPEDAKVDVNFKSPDAVNFDRHLKQELDRGQYAIIGNDSLDYGNLLRMPDHPDERTHDVTLELNSMTADQKAVLREVRGETTNQALRDNLVNDPQIFNPNTKAVKEATELWADRAFTPGSQTTVNANLEAIVATKDPALNGPFPGDELYWADDQKVALAPNATPRTKIATQFINRLNPVEAGVVRAQRGVGTNEELVQNTANDESLFHFGGSRQDLIEQTNTFNMELTHMATAPAIRLRDAHEEAHHYTHQGAYQEAHQEAFQEAYQEAQQAQQAQGDAVNIDLSDLDEAPTNDLQA